MGKGKEKACASTEEKNVFNVVREQKPVYSADPAD